MNKKYKIIIYVFFALTMSYFIYFVGAIFIWGYSTDWKLYKSYTFLLKDAVSNNLDRFGNFCEVGYNDVCVSFRTKDSIRLTIWDFKDLTQVDLKQIKFVQNVELGDLEFNRGEVLFAKSDIPVTVEYGFSFDNSLVINTNQRTKILKRIEKNNYRGFFGNIDELSLSNGITNKHLIKFNYVEGKRPALFLLYKGHNSFYLILIDSTKPIDETVINVLNLE